MTTISIPLTNLISWGVRDDEIELDGAFSDILLEQLAANFESAEEPALASVLRHLLGGRDELITTLETVLKNARADLFEGTEEWAKMHALSIAIETIVVTDDENVDDQRADRILEEVVNLCSWLLKTGGERLRTKTRERLSKIAASNPEDDIWGNGTANAAE